MLRPNPPPHLYSAGLQVKFKRATALQKDIRTECRVTEHTKLM